MTKAYENLVQRAEPEPAKPQNGLAGKQLPPGELALSPKLLKRVEYVTLDRLTGYDGNARTHPPRQLRRLEQSIREFGFVIPALVDAQGCLIAGHARLAAVRRLGLPEIPVIRISHLDEAQVRALRIADNKLTELSAWDDEKLAVELRFLLEVDFNVKITGFETPEIDMLLDTDPDLDDRGNAVPNIDASRPPVSQLGDVWLLDRHRFVCRDARDPASYAALLGAEQAQMVITDPPYNVPINGHVGGSGAITHPEFVMASGEMTEQQFELFLNAFVRNLVQFSADGSVHFIFMDWRHLHQLEGVCRRHYSQPLNLCVWAKTNGGLGSLYRSQHAGEWIFRLCRTSVPNTRRNLVRTEC